jgi:hypothetical protein
MPNEQEPRALSDAEKFAKIVVGDTILSSHTKPHLNGNSTIQECFDALLSPEGDAMTQGVLATYAGSDLAAEYLQITPSKQTLNITAAYLKLAMIIGLQHFLCLPSEEQNQIVGKLKDEAKERERRIAALDDTLHEITKAFATEPDGLGVDANTYSEWEQLVYRLFESAKKLGATPFQLARAHFAGAPEESRPSLMTAYIEVRVDLPRSDLVKIADEFNILF